MNSAASHPSSQLPSEEHHRSLAVSHGRGSVTDSKPAPGLLTIVQVVEDHATNTRKADCPSAEDKPVMFSRSETAAMSSPTVLF